MRHADMAHEARRQGDVTQARAYFERAFSLERDAAEELAGRTEAEPSRSVLYRSAATLALQCGQQAEAERLVCSALAGNPPSDIAEELRDLFEQVNFERHLKLRGITLLAEEIQMSFAGNGIGFGIAPTDQVIERVDRAQNMLYRIAERKMDRPYRDHGQPPRDVRDAVSLYMTVPRAASFAVSLVVGGRQQQLPGMQTAESVIDEVMECLELFVHGEDQALHERIPNEAYYTNFVGLAKAMAPDGDELETVGFTSIRGDSEKTVALKPRRLGEPRSGAPGPAANDKASSDEEIVVTGTLKYADSLEHHEPQIRLIEDGGIKHTIIVPPGMMDDIVRPLWGSRVLVKGVSRKKNILLTDITRAQSV
jgi:hypothetical protein